MRRLASGLAVSVALASMLAACGGSGSSPTKPTTGGSTGSGSGSSAPAVIASLVLSDTRAEVGSRITVTATVTDPDTALDQLTYKWTADNGAFSGSGAKVTWEPSADAVTPADYTLTLTVTQPGAESVSKSVSVHVNNSPKELADMSLRFLANFADSSVSPETCVSEFSDSCSGKRAELNDIADNRHDFLILDSTLRTTRVDVADSRETATVHTFCSFTSRVITKDPQSGGCKNDPGSCAYDSVQSVQGDCYTTNVYEAGRWRLCQSHFSSTGALTPFARAFFGLKATAPK